MAKTPHSTPPAGKTPPPPPAGQHPVNGQPATAATRSHTGQPNTATGQPAATTTGKPGQPKTPDPQGAVPGRSAHPPADQNAPAAPAFHLSQTPPSALSRLGTPSGKMPGGVTVTFDRSGKPVFGYGTPGTPGWKPLPGQPDSTPPAPSGTGGPTNAGNGGTASGAGSGPGGGPGTLPPGSAPHHATSADPTANNADPHHPNPGDSLTPTRGPPHPLSDDQLYREGSQDQNDPEELHQLVPSYNPSQGRPTREQLIQAGRALLPQEGALIANDHQQLHDLVPSYNPALAPTPDQLAQAGAAIVRNRQQDQDKGESQLCGNAACALKGHVPDAAGMQKGLDTLKNATSYVPDYGVATPAANAYQQFRRGDTAAGWSSVGEAAAGLIPGTKIIKTFGKPLAQALGKLGSKALPAAGKGLKTLAQKGLGKAKDLTGGLTKGLGKATALGKAGVSAVRGQVQGLQRAASEKWIRLNVALRSTRTPQNGSVFWSGFAQGNLHAAQEFARKIGGKTVEMTQAGKWLDQKWPWDKLQGRIGYKATKGIWDNVSERFAHGASGEVNAFIRGMHNVEDFGEKTYMSIERPILEGNPNVTKITEHK